MEIGLQAEGVHDDMEIRPREVISISQPVWEAYRGNYFLGQTPELRFGPESGAWTALVNPPESGIIMHIAKISVSNLSRATFIAQVIFAPVISRDHGISEEITPADLSFYPPSNPEVQLWYNSDVCDGLSRGIEPLVKIVSPCSSTSIDIKGSYSFPPGTAFAIALGILPCCDEGLRANSLVSIEWWEESTGEC